MNNKDVEILLSQICEPQSITNSKFGEITTSRDSEGIIFVTFNSGTNNEKTIELKEFTRIVTGITNIAKANHPECFK